MRLAILTVVAFSLTVAPPNVTRADDSKSFRAGTARRDITPEAPTPMWGYGARHDMLSEGTLDPLQAKAVVIEAGGEKLAIVTLDIGRAPTASMMAEIRGESEKRGIRHHLISGSHTHHGPVIELTDKEGFGKGKFDGAVAYAKLLPRRIIEAIAEADDHLKPAAIGVAHALLPLNRNRHSKKPSPPTDSEFVVVRIDAQDGKPIATLVNFAAHPVMTDAKVLKFSADYPGFLEKAVEASRGGNCLFIQGASGDMSAKAPDDHKGPELFGKLLATHAVQLAEGIKVDVPKRPSIQSKVERFHFKSRTNFSSAIVLAGYSKAFFPELIRNVARDLAGGIDPELTTVLLNNEIGFVGASGEFFCNHSLRLKERAGLPHLLFVGYCNDHHLYFPTIEGAAEGGYGADPPVSPVALGAGELMMNHALAALFRFRGKFPPGAPEVP